MQITLNQNEIETALRQYVETQVNLREGQDITIDLKAGRGPEGFTATIDIVPAGAPKAEPQAATPRGLGIAAKAGRQQAAQDAASAPQEATGTDGADDAQTAASEPEQSQGQASGAEDAESDAEPQRASGSIFAGLSKPRNS